MSQEKNDNKPVYEASFVAYKSRSAAIDDLRKEGRLKTFKVNGEDVEGVATSYKVKGYDEETRRVSVIASTADIDRYGDIIEVEGWELESYLANPIILQDHINSVDYIVGKTIKAEKNPSVGLILHIELDPFDENERAKHIGAKLKSGSLSKVSVGFVPKVIEKRLDEDTGNFLGFRFVKQELLETSFVAIPANPHATVLSHSEEDPVPASSEGDPETASEPQEKDVDNDTELEAIRDAIKEHELRRIAKALKKGFSNER